MSTRSLFGKNITLLLVILVGLFFVLPVSAVEQKSKKTVCLAAEHCWKDPNSCSTAHKGNGHVARLSLKEGFTPIPGVPLEISVCIATTDDWLCTTGKKDTDLEWYGLNPKYLDANKKPYLTNFEILSNSHKYKFEGLFKADGTTVAANPQPWDGPYEWGDALMPGAAHQWQAMFYYDPSMFAVGEGFGQKLATFDFEAKDKKCVQISWDPYGRVFDAGTLEPVSDAWVTLMFKKGSAFQMMTPQDLLGGAIVNPQRLVADGNFSFVVPDGDYKLQLSTPLTVVTDVNLIDPNYKKAYSDIYPASTGEVIQQRGAIQHRDIPITTKGTSTDIVFMESTSQVDAAGVLTLQGRVSHPLAKLFVHTEKIASGGAKTAYRILPTTFYADKWGKYAIDLDQTKFEMTDEYIETFTSLEAQKVDLRINETTKKDGSFLDKIAAIIRHFFGPVIAQTPTKSAVAHFEPILQFLDGYAYDGSGQIMPKAKVGVYLDMSNIPYVETTADATGHFTFNPEDLPQYAYSIRFTSSTGTVVKATTSTFLGQNQKYIVQNKINPYVANTPNNVKILAKAGVPTPMAGTSSSSAKSGSGKAGNFTGKSGSNNSAATTNPATKAGISNPILLIVLLLVVLIGGVGAGIMLYMKNKQPVVPPPQW